MSTLSDARAPSLRDKLRQQEEEAEAEKLKALKKQKKAKVEKLGKKLGKKK